MASNLINSLIVGDAGEVLNAVADDSIDLVITSPPYWTAVQYDTPTTRSFGTYDEYISSLLVVWKHCERVLRPNGKLAINTPILPIPKRIIKDQHTRHIKNLSNDIEHTVLGETKFERFSLYIWQKQTSKMMFGSYPYPGNIFENNTVEFINVYVKPGKPPKYSERVRTENKITQQEWVDLTQQIWFMYPQDVKRVEGHPAPFPEKLPRRLIKMYTYGAIDDFEGEVILDPFCGTGTTCVAAKQLKRRYIGIDISEQYIEFARKRLVISTFTIPPPLLVGRPKYPTKDELEQSRLRSASTDSTAPRPISDKHHRETYGRKVDKNWQLSPVLDALSRPLNQSPLFSPPTDTSVSDVASDGRSPVDHEPQKRNVEEKCHHD